MKLLIGVIGFLLAANCTLAQQQAVRTAEKTIGPGVTWSHEFDPDGPMNYNILKVELDNPLVTLEAVSGKDKLYAGEKVLQTVLREEAENSSEVIAAVNADFWSNSPRHFVPIGLIVADGMIYNMPSRSRSAFVLTKEEKPYIGRVSLNVSLRFRKSTLKIDSINSAVPKPDKVTLYTPPYGDHVAPAKGRRYLLKTEAAEFLPNQPLQVQIVPTDASTTSSITNGQFVLHLPETRKAITGSTKSGQTATLSAVMPEIDGVVASVNGGGPAIVKKGRVQVADEKGLSGSFSETKHPRTAVGFTKDRQTIYMVTVDGRQPRISIGASLAELGEYMVKLGCWEAINLDGGGSTTMVVGEKVVNKPSDFFGARTVANSLLVVASNGSGDATRLSFDPSGEPLYVPAGSTISISVSAMDQNSVPVELSAETTLEVEDSGLVRDSSVKETTVTLSFADTPGEGIIRFHAGSAKGELPVKLVALDEIRLEPHIVVLESGHSVNLFVTATADERRIDLAPEIVQITSVDESIAGISDFTAVGVSKGNTTLKVQVGAFSREYPVFVDMARRIAVEDFDSVQGVADVKGTGFEQKGTSVRLERDHVKQGSAAVRLDYQMKRGERTRINLPVDESLEEAPAAFALHVYGDGNEAWVRANVVDSNGVLFIADFTNGADGITWNNEWRRLSVPFDSLIGTNFNKSPIPKMPITVRDITIAQDQEVLKKSGSIILDGFEALYPPDETK